MAVDEDQRKKFAGRLGASIAGAGGWENLPLPERVRQTFERGVTRAELDLGDAYGKKIMPGHVPEVQLKSTKKIGQEFGAEFSVHFPYQVELSSPSGFQQAEAAALIKQTVSYAAGVGAKMIVMHPTAVYQGAFADPYTGSLQNVPMHMLCRDKREFAEFCKIHNVREGSAVKKQLEYEWENFFAAQSAVMQQQHAAAAPIFKQQFAQDGTFLRPAAKIAELMARGTGDPTTLKAAAESEIAKFANSPDPDISAIGKQALARFQQNPQGMIENYKNQIRSLQSKNRNPAESLNKWNHGSWARATLCVGGSLNEDGTVAKTIKDNPQDEFALSEQEDNFRNALARNRITDLSADEDNVIRNLKETFDMALGDPETIRLVKEHGMKLTLENLYGMNVETGWMQGAAFYTRPEHIAKAITAVREVARKHGLSDENIGLTFDTEHATLGYGDPMKFIDELKRRGIKIDHAHIVGGSASGAAHVFSHKGLGSVEDEVLRAHPGLLERLVDMGVPMTIEPGSGGIRDIEDALHTFATGGVAPQALMGREYPDALAGLGYVQTDTAELQTRYDLHQGFVDKAGMYALQPSMAQPFKASFGSLLSPSLYSGGALHKDNTPAIWSSSQPLLYSSKTDKDDQ